jgi:hypothetical protein
VPFVASWVEANDRTNVAHAAHKTFGKPTFVTLMTHDLIHRLTEGFYDIVATEAKMV